MKKSILSLLLMISACSMYAQSNDSTLIWRDTGIPGTITVNIVNYVNGVPAYYTPITFNFTWDRYFYSNPSLNKVIVHMPHGSEVCPGILSNDEVYNQVDAIAQSKRNWYLSHFTNYPTYPVSEEEKE